MPSPDPGNTIAQSSVRFAFNQPMQILTKLRHNLLRHIPQAKAAKGRAVGQRGQPQPAQHVGPGQPGDRVDAHRGVVVVIGIQQRVATVPELFQTGPQIGHRPGQTVEPAKRQLRLRQHQPHPQIMAAGQNRQGLFRHFLEIGVFAGDDFLAGLTFFLGLGRKHQRGENRIILQILSAWATIGPFGGIVVQPHGIPR